MGVAQLEQLDTYVEAKRDHAKQYTELLQNIPGIQTPKEALWAFSIYWFYTILLDSTMYGMTSRELMGKLKEAGIQSRPFWHLIHSLPPYQDCQAFAIEVAGKLYAQGLSVPCSVGLREDQMTSVVVQLSSKGRTIGELLKLGG